MDDATPPSDAIDAAPSEPPAAVALEGSDPVLRAGQSQLCCRNIDQGMEPPIGILLFSACLSRV